MNHLQKEIGNLVVDVWVFGGPNPSLDRAKITHNRYGRKTEEMTTVLGLSEMEQLYDLRYALDRLITTIEEGRK